MNPILPAAALLLLGFLIGLLLRPVLGNTRRREDAVPRLKAGDRPAAPMETDLRNVLSAMKEGVIAVDAYERVTLANAEAARILGRDESAIRGRYLWDVTADLALQNLCRQALRSPKPFSLETAAAVGDRQIEVTASPVPGGGAVLLLLDVTKLQTLERVRRDFVANVSHELRTPLAMILGGVETLRNGALENRDDAEKFLDAIDRHARRMVLIVQDLLELSRLESDDSRTPPEPVDIGELLRRAGGAFAPAAREKGLEFFLTLPEGLPSVHGDEPRLERAVHNLIDNAIKYTPHGRVTVGADADGTIVSIRISDTGVGIPSEEQERIFERFYRVDKSRSRDIGGTGLGLSIVKHVAQLHGGRVHVESRPGEGSVFTLSLPAHRG